MAEKIERFEDLGIWQDAVKMAVDIYHMTDKGKLKNDFGMKDQIRRAICSVSNNIAEGFEYNNNREFVRFLKYAKGSAGEVRNQLYIWNEAGYLEASTYDEINNRLIQLTKQIAGFKKYLLQFEKDKKLITES